MVKRSVARERLGSSVFFVKLKAGRDSQDRIFPLLSRPSERCGGYIRGFAAGGSSARIVGTQNRGRLPDPARYGRPAPGTDPRIATSSNQS